MADYVLLVTMSLMLLFVMLRTDFYFWHCRRILHISFHARIRFVLVTTYFACRIYLSKYFFLIEIKFSDSNIKFEQTCRTKFEPTCRTKFEPYPELRLRFCGCCGCGRSCGCGLRSNRRWCRKIPKNLQNSTK